MVDTHEEGFGGWHNIRSNLGHCIRHFDGLGDGYAV